MSAFTNFMEDEVTKAIFRSHGMTAHAVSTAYTVGQRVWPTNVYGPYILECVTAGTSAATEPTWATALGANTTDGGAVFKTLFPGTQKRPIYIGLFTAAPGEAGGGTEVSGGSYARAQLDPSDSNWAATSGGNGVTSNLVAINFPAAPTAAWGVVTHWAIFDAPTGGNMIIYAILTTSKTINNGDPAPSFAIGALTNTVA